MHKAGIREGRTYDDGSLSWSCLPAVQLLHASAPAFAYHPTLHAPHAEALVALLARPAVHLAHTVLPLVLKRPALHVVHAVLALRSASAVPALHRVHAMAMAFDSVPGAHVWHLVLGSASSSYLPAAQCVHTVAPVGECWPTPQLMQRVLDLRSSSMVPATQATQACESEQHRVSVLVRKTGACSQLDDDTMW